MTLIHLLDLSFLRKHLTIFSLSLGLIGLIFSPFLLSVSMFGVGICAILDISPSKRVIFSDSFRKKWGDFFRSPAFWSLMLLFVPIFVSGLYSADTPQWLERTRIKFPFLGLPIAFYFLPKLSERALKGLGIFYVSLIFLTSLGVLVNYWLHFGEINTMIGRGQHIPVPRNHIRFSLGLAIASLLSLAFSLDSRSIFRHQRSWALGTFFFLFLVQHLLAVRSGMAGLYLGLAIFMIRSLFSARYRLVGVIGILVLCAAPIIGYRYIPSLRNKINYMRYDWKMKQSGKGSEYSDSGRFLSMQLGLELGNRQPLLGIGAGDVRHEMNVSMAAHHQTKRLIPHNEYIFYYAATGIIGLGFLLAGILVPVFYHKHYRHTIFLAIQMVLLFSFLVEPTLETSMGAGYYLLWTLIGLLYVNALKIDASTTV